MPTETLYKIWVHATRQRRGIIHRPSEQEQLELLRREGMPEVWHRATLQSDGLQTEVEEWVFEGLALSKDETYQVPIVVHRAGFDVSMADVVITPCTRTYKHNHLF